MPWFRIDDGFADHPKVIRCSLAAIGLWAKAGAWCSKHLTDGAVPASMVKALGGTSRLANELVSAGLWSDTDSGFQFHDWAARNPTKQAVESRRVEDATRKRIGRESARTAVGTPTGLATDSDGSPRARARVPVPSPPDPDQAEAESQSERPAFPGVISDSDARAVGIAWHRELEQIVPGALHGFSQWQADFRTVASAVSHHPDVGAARSALVAWFFRAPDGPIGNGRVKPVFAKPSQLAKHVTADLQRASAWWAQLDDAAQTAILEHHSAQEAAQ